MRLPSPRQVYAAWPRSYWRVREPMGNNFVPGAVRGYYIDMRAKTRRYRGPSAQGIPLCKHHGKRPRIIPVTVTQLALGHYEEWITSGDSCCLQQFLRCADWLVDHHSSVPGKKSGWTYFFDIGHLRIKGPFVSAMGQGQGISVLVRAHEATKKETYLLAAKRALEPFYFDVADGGVIGYTEHGGTYFEEYPCSPHSHILNGHIFAVWGLYDYSVHTQDENIAALCQAGIDALRDLLPQYDAGHWSCYGLYPQRFPDLASPYYHELHIAQLRAMFELTGVVEFAAFADRWESYFDRWSSLRKVVHVKLRAKFWAKAARWISLPASNELSR